MTEQSFSSEFDDPRSKPKIDESSGQEQNRRPAPVITPSKSTRPQTHPYRRKDAPEMTDNMSQDDRVAVAQAYLARRKGEGAYKSSGISAEQVQAGAKGAFEASKTTIGGVIGKGIDEGAGVNVVAHAQNLLLGTQIGAAATARLNETNIARAEAARFDNRIHSKELHSSVEDWQHEDNKGKGFLSSLPASGEERNAGAQALMDTHGKEEFNKRYRESKGNKAIFAMGKKLAANNRLLAHEKKMGGDVLAPFTEEQSVGAAVPEHMADVLTAGHTIDASDVVASTTKGNFVRGVTSLSPMSDRPIGNTAKLDDEQKMRLGTYQSMSAALAQKASDDKAERESLKTADPDSRGYRPDELARRAELKGQLSDLNQAKTADREKRIGTDKIGYGYLPGQEAILKGHDAAMSNIVESERQQQLAPHEAEYAALHKKTTGKSARRVTWGTLPPAEAKELADSQTELEKHTKAGKSDDPQIQIKTEQLRTRINELKEQKASGLTPDEYARKKSAKSEIDRLKKADTSELNLSPAAQGMLDQHQSHKDDIEFQRTHGLSRQQKEEFDAATEERTSQKATRDTGLTDGERELTSFLHEHTTGVYEEAQEGHAFVGAHAGEQVSSLGRVGGMNSSDVVSEDEMSVSTAGRAAQATRAAGSVVSGTGDVLNASKKNIQKAIDDGELLKASAQLAGSVTGDVLATAGNVQIPGIGTVSKQALKSVGKVLQGGGRVLHAVGDSMAQDQDKRDRQRELTSGERLAATHNQAIDFGKMADMKPGLVSEVTEGLKGISNSGFEPIDDLKKNLSDTASETASVMAARAGEVVDHATQGLRSMSSDVTHAISNPIETPNLTTPHVELHQISLPQMPTSEPLSLKAPSLNHLATPALPIVAPALNLHEVAAPEFTKSAEQEEDSAAPVTNAEHETTAGDHAGHSADFTLAAPNLTFLKPEESVEAEGGHTNELDDEHANEQEGEHTNEQEGQHTNELDDEHANDQEGEHDSEQEGEHDNEQEEEEEDKEKSEKVEESPAKAADDEGSVGVTHHDDYGRLFDRLSTRPTMSQRIKRSASSGWSSVKNAFGFGKKDKLADHIGTSRRDRSVKPMLDRLSNSQSMSARLGRKASRAWSSVKGFFGSRQTPEEDDPARHIGNNIRPRRRLPKI